MLNYLLHLTFDGTDFHGWQSQHGVRTVQDVVEEKVAVLFEPGIRLTAAGRTDAGVHALSLPVNFSTIVERDPGTVCRALNGHLPEDVRVTSCRIVPDGFSARSNAVSRTYRYQIAFGPCRDPILRRFFWHLPVEIQAASVQNALPFLVGEHDFSSFRASGCVAPSPVKKIISAEWETLGADRFALVFEANGFLRGMVRSLAGTLMEIGRGRRPPEDVVRLLETPNRAEAGRTAPPHGLFFVCAKFGEDDSCEPLL